MVTLQEAYNGGPNIVANAGAILITKTDMTRCWDIRNSSTSQAMYFKQEANGSAAFQINKTATGAGYCMYITNAGTGDAVQINQVGESNALDIRKSSTGASPAVVISNSGSGDDIQGTNANWGVDATGSATFSSVNVCPGMVTAQNTAIAGGRVHIYDRGQGPTVNTWCTWGIGPVAWTYAPYLQGIYVVQMLLLPAVHCPVIKVTPWVAGQYDPRQGGNFNYYEEGNTNAMLLPPTAIEPHIVQTVPDLVGSIQQVDLYFQCCVAGNPAIQYPYEVWYNPEGVSHDLVFDFEILGCPGEMPA